MPVKSGLLSSPRGAGAVRSGSPSAVRGMSGQRRSSHWAVAGTVTVSSISATKNIFIGEFLG